MPLDQLLGGNLRDNFLAFRTPLSQFAATVAGVPLQLKKVYEADALPEHVACESKAGAVCAWLSAEPRRFSAQFRNAAAPLVAGQRALSAFARHLESFVVLIDTVLGAYNSHTLLLTAVFASHTAYQAAVRGQLRLHLLLCGGVDQSKSFVLDRVRELSVPGTVNASVRQTPTAIIYEANQHHVVDEMSLDQISSTSKKNDSVKSVLKSALTAGEVTCERTVGTRVEITTSIKHFHLLGAANIAPAEIDTASTAATRTAPTGAPTTIRRRSATRRTCSDSATS